MTTRPEKNFAADMAAQQDQTRRTVFLSLYFQHSNFRGKLRHDFDFYFCFRLLCLKKNAPLLGLDKIFAQKKSNKDVQVSQFRKQGSVTGTLAL